MAVPITPTEGGNLLTVYAVYGAASIGLTTWLAATLFKNGKTFLHDVFDDKPEMGEAVNRLLVVGFFMLNLGYSFLILRAEPTATNEQAVQLLVNRLGLLLVSLGLIHFVNMAVFLRIRRRTQMGDMPPPVPPQVFLGPTPPPPAPKPRTDGPEPYDTYDDADGREYAFAGGAAPDASADHPNQAPTGPPSATAWNDRLWADPQRRGW
jgi:hypothetical protein